MNIQWLVINGEEQNIPVIVPRVENFPSNPVEWQMVIEGDRVYIFADNDWHIVSDRGK